MGSLYAYNRAWLADKERYDPDRADIVFLVFREGGMVSCHEGKVVGRAKEDGVRDGELGDLGASGLLEPPFDVDDTLSVVPVGELTKDVSAQVDIARTGVARRASVSDHAL